MAHYAKDCWDAEVETSYGWIEIAGHADRSCYDLTRHAKRTKTELVAARQLKEPVTMKLVKVTTNNKEIGKVFKQDQKPIKEYLEEASEADKMQMLQDLETKNEVVIKLENGKEVTLTKEFVTFETYEKTVQEEKYVPSVIEPSFGKFKNFNSLGIGRIVYCVFEHCFRQREEDAQRTYFVFPPLVAPVKCSILPLLDKPELNTLVQSISKIDKTI